MKKQTTIAQAARDARDTLKGLLKSQRLELRKAEIELRKVMERSKPEAVEGCEAQKRFDRAWLATADFEHAIRHLGEAISRLY